jgi:hypothetical protein
MLARVEPELDLRPYALDRMRLEMDERVGAVVRAADHDAEVRPAVDGGERAADNVGSSSTADQQRCHGADPDCDRGARAQTAAPARRSRVTAFELALEVLLTRARADLVEWSDFRWSEQVHAVS